MSHSFPRRRYSGLFLFLYFGWEVVGLASYLLIGFWYKDAANGAAARKAFIVTRIGDTFMAIGLFILFHGLGTLDIQQLMTVAPQKWAEGGPMITADRKSTRLNSSH